MSTEHGALSRVAMLGPSRNLWTVLDVAREMRVLERDVLELLSILEAEIDRRGLKTEPTLPAVPLVRCGGQQWIDLHALEWALGVVMDPQTPPSEWPVVAATYKGARRAQVQERLQEVGKALFKPIRERKARRVRDKRYYYRTKPRPSGT